MKRRRPRADEDDEVGTFLGFGSVTTLESNEGDHGPIAGRLYVPDPEARRGWREYYVHHPTRKPGARPLGFGRP